MKARRLVSAILIPAYLSACALSNTSRHYQEFSPADLAEKQPKMVWVTLKSSGSELILAEPSIVADTLVGIEMLYSWGRSSYVVTDSTPEISIPVNELQTIRGSGGSGAAMTAIAFVAGLGVVILSALAYQGLSEFGN